MPARTDWRGGPATFGHNKWVLVHRALRYMVLREFTTGVRRTDCLESMGLAKVVYPEEAVKGISLILDNWRRNRSPMTSWTD
ncbi:MAG TPA: hypothetical protein VMF69_11130 [Gemmataceae bacterium]|nr:hypothetical protein [Gemmataceae bacterium]